MDNQVNEEPYIIPYTYVPTRPRYKKSTARPQMTPKEPRTLEPRSAAPDTSRPSVAAAADGNREDKPRTQGMYKIC